MAAVSLHLVSEERRRLRRGFHTSRDRRNDADRVARLHRCLIALEIPDILVVHVHVHEAAQLSFVRVQVFPKTVVLPRELGQQLTDSAAADLYRLLLVREWPERRGNQNLVRHDEFFLIECGTVLTEPPRGHLFGNARAHRHDHVGKKRPGVIEIVLRRSRRMVGMRMVEAKQLGAARRGMPFRVLIILGTHQKPPARSFLRGVRQRERLFDDTIPAEERPAAFVGERLRAVPPDGLGHGRPKRERHQFTPPMSEPSAGCSQNCSERYFSPPSQKTRTITASDAARAIRSVAARFAPLEMPTSIPSCTASCRVSSYDSSVPTRTSSSASVGS